MNKSALRKHVERRFARCSPEQVQALLQYAELVRTFGARMNLTAAKSADSYDEILFSDADALDRCIGETPLGHQAELRCVDVGAGAGAPAIPLCVLRPEASFTLVEPLRKRVTFLRTAIGSLDLASRITVVEDKLDWERPQVAGAPFDLAISRATVAPEVWLEAGRKLAPRVGLFHTSCAHQHPALEVESAQHLSLADHRKRFVAVFRTLAG